MLLWTSGAARTPASVSGVLTAAIPPTATDSLSPLANQRPGPRRPVGLSRGLVCSWRPGSQPPNTAKLDGLAGFTCAQGPGTTPRRGMDVRDRHDAGARYHRVGLGGRPPLAASVPGRLRAGTVLIARGKFSIVIAALGAITADGAELGAMAAAYVLLTAMAGPVAAKYADRLGAAVSRRVSPDRGHLSR